MDAAKRLARLREVLFESPSKEVWEEILGLYEDWDYTNDLDVGIDYAVGPLEAWPETLRRAPKHWCQVMLGQPKYLIRRTWERGNRTHPAMKLVRHLNLQTNFLGKPRLKPKALKCIVKAKPLRWITRLSLDGHQFGDDGAYELGEAVHLKSLKHLSLEVCSLGCQGVWDLIEGKGRLLDGLESLVLNSNPIGNVGARGLAQCEGLGGLERLELKSCRITRQGWEALFGSPYLSNLTHFAAGSHGSSLWIEGMAQAPFAVSVQTLELGWGVRDAKGLKQLMAGQWPMLVSLDVSGASCSTAVAREFAQWVVDQGLSSLRANYVSDELRQALWDMARDNPALELEAKEPEVW